MTAVIAPCPSLKKIIAAIYDDYSPADRELADVISMKKVAGRERPIFPRSYVTKALDGDKVTIEAMMNHFRCTREELDRALAIIQLRRCAE